MSYLGRSAKLSRKTQEKVSFLATAGQTSKTGLSYVPTFVEVSVNGILLTDVTDYTATSGSSITFSVALELNDEVTVVSLKTFALADHYTKVESDAAHYTKSAADARFEPIDSAYTKAEADANLAALVDSSPAALNTLNELAAALGDDANFSTTITNSIATKLPLAGGTMTGDTDHADNAKARFGNSDDLQIYHDGSHSNIEDTGTGNLNIRGSNLWLTKPDGTVYFGGVNSNGESRVYFNGSQKLATTATGIDVTGDVIASQSITIGTGGTYSAGSIYSDASWGMILRSKTASGGGQGAEFMFASSTGSERMRIDSSGNVGIGEASPSEMLHIKDSGNDDPFGGLIIKANNGSANVKYGWRGLDGSDQLRFATSGTERMRIDAAGEVLIGTTTQGRETDLAVVGTDQSPTGAWSQLGIYSNDSYAHNKGGSMMFGGQDGTNVRSWFAGIKGAKENNTSGNYAGYLAFYTRPSGSTPVERMRIDSAGVVRFKNNIEDNSHGLMVRSSNVDRDILECKTSSTGGNGLIHFYNPNGIVGYISTSGSSTAYNTSSDYRLKENVTPMSGATAQTKLLKPCNFDWITGGNVNGFIAHELAEVVPEAVHGTKDAMMDEEYEVTPAVVDDEGNETTAAVMGTRSVPDMQGIDQSKLVPLLTATIQELIARIEALEA